MNPSKSTLFCLLLIIANSSFGSVAQFQSRFSNFQEGIDQKLRLSRLLDKGEISKLLGVLRDRSKRKDLDSHFLGWIRHLPDFVPVWQAVGYYARPRSLEGFDKRNKKNAGSVVKSSNISRQREFFLEHRDLLLRLEREYQVNAEILVALCSMETRLNKARLPHLAYAVFATQLGFLEQTFALRQDPVEQRRVERLLRMARHNLVSLFLYTRENSISVEEVRSSWAGACGPMQFLPFNFHYLRDGDLDGDVDLRKLSDALAGAANFLNQRGWTTRHNSWFESGNTDSELLKVLKRYNANDEYAAGVLRSARILSQKINVSKMKAKTAQSP